MFNGACGYWACQQEAGTTWTPWTNFNEDESYAAYGYGHQWRYYPLDENFRDKNWNWWQWRADGGFGYYPGYFTSEAKWMRRVGGWPAALPHRVPATNTATASTAATSEEEADEADGANPTKGRDLWTAMILTLYTQRAMQQAVSMLAVKHPGPMMTMQFALDDFLNDATPKVASDTYKAIGGDDIPESAAKHPRRALRDTYVFRTCREVGFGSRRALE